MRPIAFELPLPESTVPLGWPLAIVVGACLVLAGLAWRMRARGLLGASGAAALLATAATWRLGAKPLEVGPIPLYSFGVTLALAVAVGWALTARAARSAGVRTDAAAAAYLGTAVGGLLGARGFYLALQADAYPTLGDALALTQGGLSLSGAALGSAFGSWVACRRHALRWLSWADLVAPALASSVFLASLGAYLAGSDYGRPLPAAAPHWLAQLGTFPRWSDWGESMGTGAPAWLAHVASGLAPAESRTSAPVHPTQLYESLAAAALFAWALALRQSQRQRGETFLCLALAYLAVRYGLDFLRGDPERGLIGPSLGTRWPLVAGLGVFAAAFRTGPLRHVLRSRPQRMAAVAVIGALAAYGIVAARGRAQVSAIQWLALGAAAAIAVAWRHAHPLTPAPAQAAGSEPPAT